MPAALDPVALAQALIRCPSVTPEEGGALGELERVLTPLGFTCHRLTFGAPGTPEVQNLYARLGTAAPNFCFAGHTDVVPVGDAAAWQVHPPAPAIEGDPHQRDPPVVLDDREGGGPVRVIAARLGLPKLRDVHQSMP